MDPVSHSQPNFGCAPTEASVPSRGSCDGRGRALHRIAEVRLSQGITLRTVARRCGQTVGRLREEESPQADLCLSSLYRWAEALRVPVSDLLIEPDATLSPSVAERAKLVRLMKSVEALRAHAESGAVRRLADTLRQQLLEIMPELVDVTAWPSDSARRPAGITGRISENPISLEGFDSSSRSELTG